MGAYINPLLGPETAYATARYLEELGYESMWMSQFADEEEATVFMTAAACQTERIGIGIALIPIYSRHPVTTVQTAASLDLISRGRFRLGLGVGHELTVQWMWGLEAGPPVVAMREYLTIVRAALATGQVHFEGRYFTARWRYTRPRRSDLPILVGALGPRMLELAGELADGVLLWLCAPRYIREVVIPHVRKGRARAGKTLDGFEIQAPVFVSAAAGREPGLTYVRRMLDFYSKVPVYRRMLELSGFGAEVAQRQISDSTIGQLSGLGSCEAVREAVQRYREAGATLPAVVVTPPYDDTEACDAALVAAVAD